MPAQRSRIARVLMSPWWWCVVVAAVASWSAPLLLFRNRSAIPLTPTSIFARIDGTIWREDRAFGYSTIFILHSDQRAKETFPSIFTVSLPETSGPPYKEPPRWITWFDACVREVNSTWTTEYSIEGFGVPFPSLARTVVLTPTGWVQRRTLLGPNPMPPENSPWPYEVL